MNSEDRFFLLVRDRRRGHVTYTEFEDPDRATEAYARAEALHRDETRGDDAPVEVVLIAGESLESVRDMYPHYFAEGDRDKRQRDLLAAI